MDYIKLVEVYEKLEKTSKKLEKTAIISEFLKNVKSDETEIVINLLQGTVFPLYDQREIGVSSRLIIKIIASSSGEDSEKVEKLWAKKGDLGLVAEELMKDKKQKTLFSEKLTIKKVYENLRKLATLEGEGTVAKKIGLVVELLNSASSIEAKYIVRTVLEVLRLGVAEGILRDALVAAYFPRVQGIGYGNFKEESKKNYKNTLEVESLDDVKNIDKYDWIKAKDEKVAREIYNHFANRVQELYNLSHDFGKVAVALKEKTSIKFEVKVGIPINSMLAVRVETLQDAFDALGTPLLVDWKLDGFRAQIHKDKDNVIIFTRKLENVTKQFSELIPIIRNNVKAEKCILDSEIIGYDKKNNKYLSFQSMSMRIKRKYDLEKTAKDIPVEINVFDILYKDGKNLMNESQEERRKILEKTIKEEKWKIKVVEGKIVKSVSEADKFYKESLKVGNEGIMLKSLTKKYSPGRKVGGWIKFKPNLEPLDLVIVGAVYGEGKRASVLSSFNLACYDNGELRECGMSSSGLKEKDGEGLTYNEMTKMLNPLIIERKGRNVKVKAKIVVEVIYEEIQESKNYDSGYALRFPRISVLRFEKPINEIATRKDLENIYKKQRGRNKKAI